MHEVELVVLIGRTASRVSVVDAANCIGGYAVGLDMTARDLQAEAKKGGRPWSVAKGFDTFCPVGRPVPASPDLLAGLEVITSVDGEPVRFWGELLAAARGMTSHGEMSLPEAMLAAAALAAVNFVYALAALREPPAHRSRAAAEALGRCGQVDEAIAAVGRQTRRPTVVEVDVVPVIAFLARVDHLVGEGPEGKPAAAIEDLVTRGLLPAGRERRPHRGHRRWRGCRPDPGARCPGWQSALQGCS